MDAHRLGVIAWRHDAAVHLFMNGSDRAYCNKRHPEGVIFDSDKADRLGRPSCRSCRRAWRRLITQRIPSNSQTPEATTERTLI